MSISFYRTCINCPIVGFVQLFGWDLASSWKSANQNQCHTFLQDGKLAGAHAAYQYMMDMCDEAMKDSCFELSTGKHSVMPSSYNHTCILFSIQ